MTPSTSYLFWRIRQICIIAWTTLVESAQQPATLMIQLTAVLSTLLVPIFQFHRFSEEGRLARESGLSCCLIFGLALAVSIAGSSVASEITRGTAAAIIGKPVTRTIFVVAKWLGVCLLLLVFWFTMVAATLLAERGSAHFIVNEQIAEAVMDQRTLFLAIMSVFGALIWAAGRHYFNRARFGVNAFFGITIAQLLSAVSCGFYDRLGAFHFIRTNAQIVYVQDLDLRIIGAALLVFFALLIFSAGAVALATRFQTSTVLTICIFVLILGLAGDSLAIHVAPLSGRGLLAGLLPDIQQFWMCDALAQGGRIPWRYLGEASLYTLISCTLFLVIGGLAFRTRDLG